MSPISFDITLQAIHEQLIIRIPDVASKMSTVLGNRVNSAIKFALSSRPPPPVHRSTEI